MKFFKVLTLLTLGAALSCGANGSPVTPDGLVKRQNKDELTTMMNLLPGLAQKAFFDTKSDRAAFNKAVITRLTEANNHYNYVICVSAHKYVFYGTKGVDWDHYELNKDYISYSITYDIVVGGAGTFTFLGKEDYSYRNWAWAGVVVPYQNQQSNVIHFVNHVSGAHQLSGLLGNQTWVKTEA
ncbi:hypothetical protein JOM56_011228 [Amanita muscaria]